ncbi:MAG: DNA polymerase III subunit alpha [Eubacteriales bacterium]|nr:DNA polymerase III subunit alpha [Eubacteriales bacterium]
MGFVHLHLHTSYSLLDGSGRIKEMVDRASSLNQKAIAITDHGVMYGAIEFYKACREKNIKPILGCEVYVAPGSRFDREFSKGEDRYNHLILLCKNNEGYHNLIKIVSTGFRDGFYYKPRVDYETLEKYSKGLICTSACLAGEIPKYIVRNEYNNAKKTAERFKSIFGCDNFYLELQDHGYEDQKKVNISLVRLSKELNIPMIATNDVHYTLQSDVEAHDALLCIQTGKKVNDNDRLKYLGGQFYIKSEEEMRKLFPYALEAIDNTEKIANMCDVSIEFTKQTHKYHLPIFNTPNNEDSFEYLKKISNDGLRKRYNLIDEVLRKRLEYELSTINNMGFSDYFLIVQDYINYAKKSGIPVGPGRGSAAGSLVAYSLGITDIDPIKYNLLFERFLNPERVTMPDIDVDFCEERRDEVIEYVSNKYGKENVSQIITFGTLKAKAVFRDVGRVLDVEYSKCNENAKLIPNQVNLHTLLHQDITKFDQRDVLKVSEFREHYENDPQVKKIVDLSLRLEGIPRHMSIHASGIVIAPSHIDDYIAIARTPEGSIVAAETMTTLEELGLLKMDFLGLRNLTAIQNTLSMLKEEKGIEINFSKMEYNDKKVFDLICKGQTEGIFQLESQGMTQFMKELKPTNIEDVIAGIALYRPGPMDFIPKYIKGKRLSNNIKYDCKELEPILKETYGCIVYQEQVMEIFKSLAGYSLGGADMVRRAMSKKHLDELERERKAFIFGDKDRNIKGCVPQGISETIAYKIFEDVLGFASYAFNKSHAAAYAYVAYQTAYLKCYYPIEFISALCNSVIDKREELSNYIRYAKSININILPPDINNSFDNFTVKNNSILIGFSALKGVGGIVAKSIIDEREINGKYKSFYNFLNRVKDRNVNKNAIESLIFAGAFDAFSGNRKQKIIIYPLIIKNSNKSIDFNVDGQLSLADVMISKEGNENNINIQDETLLNEYKDVREYSKDDLYMREKETSGMYLSGHPLEEYKNIIKHNTNINTLSFYYDEDNENSPIEKYINKNIKIAGICTSYARKLTKNGYKMANLTLEDEYGDIEVIVFPNTFEKYEMLLNENEKLLIEGKVDLVDQGKSKLLAEKIIKLDDKKNILYICFENVNEYKEKYNNVINILKKYDGTSNIIIKLIEEKKQKLIQNYNVNINTELINELQNILKKENIIVEED